MSEEEVSEIHHVGTTMDTCNNVNQCYSKDYYIFYTIRENFDLVLEESQTITKVIRIHSFGTSNISKYRKFRGKPSNSCQNVSPRGGARGKVRGSPKSI